MLSSAVQCSLSDGGSLRVSQQQPKVLRKLEIPPNKKMEYAEEELDTGSICSDDYSSDEEWLVFSLSPSSVYNIPESSGRALIEY